MQEKGRGSQGSDESISLERAQLEQMQRLATVGAVASSVAHEFNNILTAILNQAKLGQQSKDPAQKQTSFDRILASARRAARITTGVLALSRNRLPRKERTNIVELVDEVLAVVEKDLIQHKVRIERDFRDAPQVEVVPAQIEQVIINLIINARQAMPRGGMLRMSVNGNPTTGMVEIGVADTGIGIEPDKLSCIFEPFYTTKSGPDESGQGGSGLGLSICREIVERHQGRIRVESLVGRGTKFIVKIPVNANPLPVRAA